MTQPSHCCKRGMFWFMFFFFGSSERISLRGLEKQVSDTSSRTLFSTSVHQNRQEHNLSAKGSNQPNQWPNRQHNDQAAGSMLWCGGERTRHKAAHPSWTGHAWVATGAPLPKQTPKKRKEISAVGVGRMYPSHSTAGTRFTLGRRYFCHAAHVSDVYLKHLSIVRTPDSHTRSCTSSESTGL